MCTSADQTISAPPPTVFQSLKEQMKRAGITKLRMGNFQLKFKAQFPATTGLEINMMPYRIGDPRSIPADIIQYWPMIQLCERHSTQIGKVGYLTIQESWVMAGCTQRRPGLHTDRHPSTHGLETKGGGRDMHSGCDDGSGWGGSTEGTGMYLASTVDDSCAVWDVRVETPGEQGDCEHLRDLLGPGTIMMANMVYWLSDATPHEALPAKADGHRQFFRWVSNDVSVWYEQHSTRNPLGIEPDARIITENKFESYVLK